MSWFEPLPSFPRKREPSDFATLDPRLRGKTLVPRLRGDDHRRRALLAALAASATMVACGFQLRGQATYAFNSVYVNAPAFPALAAELRQSLAGAGTATIAETPAAAQVIVDITSLLDDKQVLSLSPGGRVQEYALAKAVGFRVRDPDGREWLTPDEIVVRRTYTYDDTERLAREIQEQRLLRDMQTDAVQQIVRRLQAARPPA
jgi:LPS-assembly lipoprotein